MVGIQIRIEVTAEKRDEFLQATEALLDARRGADPACIDCRVFEEHGAPSRFLWHEDWDDRASVEARLASPGFRTLVGALRVLGQAHDIRILDVEPRSTRDEGQAAS